MAGMDRGWGDGSTALIAVNFEFGNTVKDPSLAWLNAGGRGGHGIGFGSLLLAPDTIGR